MVRIRLPPAESQQTFGPSKWTGPPTSRRFLGAEFPTEPAVACTLLEQQTLFDPSYEARDAAGA